jgi:CheY-like chemotaxis protein
LETPSKKTLDEICGVDEPKDKEESWAPVAPGRFNGTRVLLAEDDPINQSLGVAFLTNLGANVDVANNGKEAVEKFENNEYDIVFMDCDMPVMDGFDATRRIREVEGAKEPKTPIVAMTAYARQGDKENCIAAGMDAHVPKPITVDILKELADKFL